MLPLFAKRPATRTARKRAHVAVVPFPQPPHPETFLLLSRKIAAANPDIRVSVFTPVPYAMYLYNYWDPQTDENLHFLPVGDWPSSNATQDEFTQLYVAEIDVNLRKSFAQFEKEFGEKITYVVADAFLADVCSSVADERGIGWSAVWTSSATAIAAYMHGDEILRKINESNPNPSGFRPPQPLLLPGPVDQYLPGFPPSVQTHELPRGALGGVDPIDKMFQGMVRSLPKADTVLVDSFRHLESSVTSALLGPNFHLGGPFSLNLPFPPNIELFDIENIFPWLETRATSPGSVVYINLGTTVTVAEMQVQVVGLAEALEATGIPFLWFVAPTWPRIELPEGFVERTSKSGQGKVVRSSAGLVRALKLESEIMRHVAVGAQLGNPTWRAVSESVAAGKPIICNPMGPVFDEMLNAALVDRVWGIGVGVEGYTLMKERAERALRRVMVEDEGKEIKAKISELRKHYYNKDQLGRFKAAVCLRGRFMAAVFGKATILVALQSLEAVWATVYQSHV